ncbi:MAG TPA: hypothetical protein VFQ30_02385 [Ktedonobacteraceae bacterium]|nr:hypothetical protein [Ktedonobacteraceae bacterium]
MSRKQGKLTLSVLTILVALLVGMFTAGPTFASVNHSATSKSSTPKVSATKGKPVNGTMHSANMNSLPKESLAAALTKAPRQLPIRMAHANKNGASTNKNAPVNKSPIAASGASKSVITGFQGMADSATICPYFGGCQPPDMALATSSSLVLQGVNTSYAFYNTSGHLVLGPINDVNWYGVPPLPNNCDPAGPFLSDPRAFYDPNTGLFWTATLQVEAAAFGVGVNCPNLSLYWIANINPKTGVMHVYSFDMTLGGTVGAGADYTQFGFNKDVVSFTGNMFDFTTGNYDFAEALFVNKHRMEQGKPVTAVPFTQLGGTSTSGSTVFFDTVQPVETITPVSTDPGVEYLINSFNMNGDLFGDDCFLTACQGFIVWAYEPSNQTLGGTLILSQSPNPNYIVPPNADQPGCIQCVETIDTRITGTPVYSVGGGQGLITFSLDTGVNNGGAFFPSVVPGILWGQVQVTNFPGNPVIPLGNLYQSGYVSFAGDQAASFGAEMQDKNGNVFMVFDTMSSNLNPSIMIASRSKSTPLGSLSNFHFVIKGPSATFDSRWGDYEAASYTGFSSNHVWVASQYSISGDWTTFIAQVS